MESDSESLNMEFIDDGRIDDSTKQILSPKDAILNDLNKFMQILSDATKPTEALDIFQDLIKIEVKAKNCFKQLPYLYCQCVLDLYNIQFDEQMLSQKLQRRAKDKFDQKLKEYNHLKEDAIKYQSFNENDIQISEVVKRDDGLNVDRIYSFFGISFKQIEKEVTEQQQMDEQESLNFIHTADLANYSQTSIVMNYSLIPSHRAHAALTYLENLQNQTTDLLPALSFAMREILQNNLLDSTFVSPKSKRNNNQFYTRLITVGASLSQFCDCSNHLIIILYLQSSEDLQLQYVPGLIRSFSAQDEITDNFIFSEPEHCGVTYDSSILDSDYKFYENNIADAYMKFASQTIIEFVNENILKLKSKHNQTAILYGVLCFIKQSSISDLEQFMERITLTKPVKLVAREDSDDNVSNKNKINLPLTIDIQEEKEEDIPISDEYKLYFTIQALIAIKYVNELNTIKAAQSIDKILSYDGSFDGKFITSLLQCNIVQVLQTILAIRVVDLQLFVEDKSSFDCKIEKEMLKDLKDGSQQVEIQLLQQLFNGQLQQFYVDKVSILANCLQGMCAKVFLKANAQSIDGVDSNSLTELFEIDAEMAKIILQ